MMTKGANQISDLTDRRARFVYDGARLERGETLSAVMKIMRGVHCPSAQGDKNSCVEALADAIEKARQNFPAKSENEPSETGKINLDFAEYEQWPRR